MIADHNIRKLLIGADMGWKYTPVFIFHYSRDKIT